MAEELDYGRVERTRPVPETVAPMAQKGRPSLMNFVGMLSVAIALDAVGLILNVAPGIGFTLQIIADIIFIPWFYFSGMSFTGKRIGVLGFTTVVESIPVLGNLPFLTLGIVASYYLNGH